MRALVPEGLLSLHLGFIMRWPLYSMRTSPKSQSFPVLAPNQNSDCKWHSAERPPESPFTTDANAKLPATSPRLSLCIILNYG